MAEVVNRQGGAPICLVCEHASGFIPPSFRDLGLSPSDRYSHASVDIGAEDMARLLSNMLDAPLVLACVSRLVCDLNRPAAAPEATPEKVEQIDVPGNRGLTQASRVDRAQAVYHPFHNEVTKLLSGFATPPVFVTLHSFTPVWNGVARATEIGFLHDANDQLAQAMLAHADSRYRTELNQPYSAKDGVTHTLQRHAGGLQNVMIEVRNDLLSDPQTVAQVATSLATTLNAALARDVRA